MIYEFVLEHNWMIEQMSSTYFVFFMLLVLETAFFQSVITFLFCLFIFSYQYNWILQKEPFKKQVLNKKVQKAIDFIMAFEMMHAVAIFMFSTQRFAFSWNPPSMIVLLL